MDRTDIALTPRCAAPGRAVSARRALLALLASLAAAPAFALSALPGCQLTIHAVSPAGMVEPAPLIDARHVLEVRAADIDPNAALARFLVLLDEAGAAAMAAHTAANAGRAYAVRCDGEIIAQPVIKETVRSPVVLLVDRALVVAPEHARDLDVPHDILAWVELPRVVAVADKPTLTITVRNARTQGAFAMTSVNIGDGLLTGFDVVSMTPEPQRRDHSLGTLELGYPVEVAPGTDWVLTVTLRPKRAGVFIGDVDIWAGDRFLTRVAQVQVR